MWSGLKQTDIVVQAIMAENVRSVRGMNDRLPEEMASFQAIAEHCRKVFSRRNYKELQTPVVESTPLFSRGIGEATDIVEKEMYTFPDRKGRSLTLRPEMTASCARAYIQHGIFKSRPFSEWFYIAPMFRYERMQTGRYRQFWQAGVEVFGDRAPTLDAEVASVLYEVFSGLGVTDLTMLVNSVGDKEDRVIYREKLLQYLTPFSSQLCGDCQRRINTNPLRVLDCKVPSCKEIAAAAPALADSLRDESKQYFHDTCNALQVVGVPYKIDKQCVRGLDYYTGPVFELVSTSKALGKQTTLGAGGRYDGLVQQLGGPSTPAVGFALGMERAMLVSDMIAAETAPSLFIATLGTAAKVHGLALASKLADTNVSVSVEHRDVKLKAQLRRAAKNGFTWALVLGDNEIESGKANLKNLDTKQETEIELARLADNLNR